MTTDLRKKRAANSSFLCRWRMQVISSCVSGKATRRPISLFSATVSAQNRDQAELWA